MTKTILEVEVLSNRQIAGGLYALDLDYAGNTEEIRPGQFVTIYLPRQDMLLPRPISICRHVGDRLTLVYAVVGKGTELLSEIPEMAPDNLKPARCVSKLRMSTPLGNGYNLDVASESAMLIGGGLGVPPMLELAYALKAKGRKVVAVLGFREESFLINEMKKAGAEVHIALETSLVSDGYALPAATVQTEPTSEVFSGNVMELIRAKGLKADQYFACGPKGMLKAVTEYCLSTGRDVQVSLEERMGCGYGACVGCTCKVRAPGVCNGDPARPTGRSKTAADSIGIQVVQKRVCKDGPVFWGSEVIFDE